MYKPFFSSLNLMFDIESVDVWHWKCYIDILSKCGDIYFITYDTLKYCRLIFNKEFAIWFFLKNFLWSIELYIKNQKSKLEVEITSE